MQNNQYTTIQDLFFRPKQEDGGINEYAASILIPEKVASRYADSSRLGSITKTVLTSEVLDIEDLSGAGLSSDFVIVVSPYDYRNEIKYFRISNDRQWVFMRTIPMQQDLTPDFLKQRIVSGQISLVSSTRAGGNFDIAGQINGIVTETPPFNTDILGYSRIMPFRMDDHSRVMGVSIKDGVGALTPMRNQNPMIPSNTVSEDGIVSFSTCVQSQTATFHGKRDPAHFSDYEFEISRESSDTTYSPFFERIELNTGYFGLGLSIDSAAATGDWSLKVYSPWYDGTAIQPYRLYDLMDNRMVVDNYIEFYCPGFVEKIVVVSSTPIQVEGTSVRISKLAPMIADMTPMSIFVAEGIELGTKFTINGTHNFEVVPNSTLIKNVKLDLSPNPPLSDCTQAQNLLWALSGRVGHNLVYPLPLLKAIQGSLGPELFLRSNLKGMTSFGVGTAAAAILTPMILDQGLDLVKDQVGPFIGKGLAAVRTLFARGGVADHLTKYGKMKHARYLPGDIRQQYRKLKGKDPATVAKALYSVARSRRPKEEVIQEFIDTGYNIPSDSEGSDGEEVFSETVSFGSGLQPRRDVPRPDVALTPFSFTKKENKFVNRMQSRGMNLNQAITLARMGHKPASEYITQIENGQPAHELFIGVVEYLMCVESYTDIEKIVFLREAFKDVEFGFGRRETVRSPILEDILEELIKVTQPQNTLFMSGIPNSAPMAFNYFNNVKVKVSAMVDSVDLDTLTKTRYGTLASSNQCLVRSCIGVAERTGAVSEYTIACIATSQDFVCDVRGGASDHEYSPQEEAEINLRLYGVENSSANVIKHSNQNLSILASILFPGKTIHVFFTGSNIPSGPGGGSYGYAVVACLYALPQHYAYSGLIGLTTGITALTDQSENTAKGMVPHALILSTQNVPGTTPYWVPGSGPKSTYDALAPRGLLSPPTQQSSSKRAEKEEIKDVEISGFLFAPVGGKREKTSGVVGDPFGAYRETFQDGTIPSQLEKPMKKALEAYALLRKEDPAKNLFSQLKVQLGGTAEFINYLQKLVLAVKSALKMFTGDTKRNFQKHLKTLNSSLGADKIQTVPHFGVIPPAIQCFGALSALAGIATKYAKKSDSYYKYGQKKVTGDEIIIAASALGAEMPQLATKWLSAEEDDYVPYAYPNRMMGSELVKSKMQVFRRKMDEGPHVFNLKDVMAPEGGADQSFVQDPNLNGGNMEDDDDAFDPVGSA